MFRFARLALVLGLSVVTSSCATPPGTERPIPSETPGLPALPRLTAAQQRGQSLAFQRCAGCHTVGFDDGGAPDGPAFAQLARRYNAIALERRFAEVAAHGYDRMPPVPFTREQAEDLVAYLDALRAN